MRVRFFYIKLAIAFFLFLPIISLMRSYLRSGQGGQPDRPLAVRPVEQKTEDPCKDNECSDTVALVKETFPHLRSHNCSSLLPKMLLGSLKKKKLVMTIPLVKGRSRSYLSQTVRSLLKWMDKEDREKVSILVFVRSENQEFVDSVANVIRLEFKESVENGHLQLFRVPSNLQPPDLSDLVPTFNDSQARMKWRTRQNIDFAYMMSYASHFGDYYLQLEDDVTTQKDYLKNILFYLEVNKHRPWLMIEFAELGFIGKCFKSGHVRRLAQSIAIYHRYKPADWILRDFLVAHYCSPETTPKICLQKYADHILQYVPSLFNHIGYYSTLEGKVQKLKEFHYKGRSHKLRKVNIPANVTSSFRSSRASIQDSYNHPLFHKIESQRTGNAIDISISKTSIQGIMVTTGTDEEPTKILSSSVVVFAKEGKKSDLLGAFDERGRFEAFLQCRQVDGFHIRAMETSDVPVLLTNIIIIPC